MQPEPFSNPMAESAKGWHNIQLAVMGFIGLCGVIKMGNHPDGPDWLNLWSAGMVALAFVSSLLSMWMVGSVAFPLYNFNAGAQMPADSPRRLRGGIRMTFVSIVLMVLGALTGWWPSSGDSSGKMQVQDANGATACGDMLAGAPAGSIRLSTADGVLTISLRTIASMNQVSSC